MEVKVGNVNLTKLREEAEKAIAKFRRVSDTSPVNEAALSVTQLLEELHIHQTELELQNQQLLQSQADLALSVEKYRALFNDLPLPAVLVDGNGLIMESNRQAIDFFGLRHSRLKQQYALTRFVDGPQQMELLTSLQGTGAEGATIIAQTPMKKDNGRLVPCDLHVLNPKQSDDARYSGSLVVVVDKSLEMEVIENSMELQRSKEAADAANKAKSTFLANMSHEIRTPLNAITGMAYLMRRSGVSAEQEDHLSKIESAGQHLLNIITAVLDLSKIEAGKLALEEVPLNICQIFQNVEAIIGETIRAKGLSFEADCDIQEDGFLGDATRIQQALLNFLGNAAKFTQQGGVQLRAYCEGETLHSRTIRFEVQDTGLGISPDVLPRLFNAFEQADNSITREYGGTGLGLTITRKLAKLMGGDAGVESQLGWGSTFWFTAVLRKSAGAHGTSQVTSDEDVENAVRSAHQGKRILLVEDEEINREIAQVFLEEVALQVDTAANGQAALDLALSNQYDAILMDVQMPVMDGWQTTRAIREIPIHHHTPIIALTANAFSDDRKRSVEAGMNEFLAKPAPPAEIYKALLRVWEG